MALQSVLFALVNVAGQTPAGPAGPFTGAVFKHYFKRLSCHLESKCELHSTLYFIHQVTKIFLHLVLGDFITYAHMNHD